MVFASSIFLYYFLPAFLAVYYLTPRGLRSYTLSAASYVFYGWWRPDFCLLMITSTIVDFSAGRGIVRAHDRGVRGKPWLLLSICVNLGLLAYFKYANFGIDTLNHLLGATGSEKISWPHVVLPVGISFYTFQTMSYTIDVYRGVAKPVRGFGDFLCYVSMFPQLVAGPIVRYNTVAEQLHSRSHTFRKFWLGILWFQAGLAKKVLIADVLGQIADRAFAMGDPSSATAWIGVVAYAFQIYFDFSGYSDMAIGLGLMMGFRFPINFNAPYRSLGITDFWRRWHISLSSFLRDYLYVPLGGNRRGPVRTYINLALTMLLGGLWHGAAWTFIAWGAYQGFWLIVERAAGKRTLYAFLPKPAQLVVTFVVVLVGWVFFRAASISDAFAFLGAMFGGGGDGPVARLEVASIHIVSFVAAAIVVWGFPTTQRLVPRATLAYSVVLQIAFVLSLLQLHFNDHVPFLYFQF